MTAAVEASGIEVAYGDHRALQASTFRFEPGTMVALIGPNGAGKSTVLDVIAGLVRPSSGRITVLGVDPAAARRRLSYVVQSRKVNETMPVTVAEVVQMGRYPATGWFGRLGTEDRRRVAEAMGRLEITDLATRHLRELSGGERQRVFVAQGLAQDHEVLLLDEPLTGLDMVSASIIETIMREERDRGTTVVFATHDLAEAARADLVVALANRCVAVGTPAEVLSVDVLQAVYRHRFVEVGEGVVVLDDAAHRPGAGRHVHRERTIHTEPPGSGLHPE